MRSLLYTTGSPFARGVRVILDELDLEYERQEEITTPSVAERASHTPTLQVPTLCDAGLTLWESGLIADYLMRTYAQRPDTDFPLAPSIEREENEWEDRLTMATVQTLGTSSAMISQMTWTGVGIENNSHVQRCAARIPEILGWLEMRIGVVGQGFIPNLLSAQDVFLACHIGFIRNRPLGVDLKLHGFPKIEALVERLNDRPSFQVNPIRWWEPGVVGYNDNGAPVFE